MIKQIILSILIAMFAIGCSHTPVEQLSPVQEIQQASANSWEYQGATYYIHKDANTGQCSLSSKKGEETKSVKLSENQYKTARAVLYVDGCAEKLNKEFDINGTSVKFGDKFAKIKVNIEAIFLDFLAKNEVNGDISFIPQARPVSVELELMVDVSWAIAGVNYTAKQFAGVYQLVKNGVRSVIDIEGFSLVKYTAVILSSIKVLVDANPGEDLGEMPEQIEELEDQFREILDCMTG